jgi:hypothetical protein
MMTQSNTVLCTDLKPKKILKRLAKQAFLKFSCILYSNFKIKSDKTQSLI